MKKTAHDLQYFSFFWKKWHIQAATNINGIKITEIMHNLKGYGGTFKGMVGECMFKLTRKNLFLTRFHPKYRFMKAMKKYLTESQTKFLDLHWYSIDAIEIINDKPVLFEVKTRNRYYKPLRYQPKTTASSTKLYQNAQNIGFYVKLIYVWFEKEWNFSVEVKDFSQGLLCIDKGKKWDGKKE